MAWATETLLTDLGAETARNEDGTLTSPFMLARDLCLAGAINARTKPVDAAYPDIEDQAGLKLEATRARRDGFTGKLAIHASQVPIINEIFSSRK